MKNAPCSAMHAHHVLGLFYTLGAIVQISADGLSGEHLVTQRWRDLFSVHSPLTNPAFLTEESYSSARLVFAPVLQGRFKLLEAGVTVPAGLYQSMGLTAVYLNGGDVREGAQSAPAKVTSDNPIMCMLSYAVNPWNRVSLGVNIDIAYAGNFGEPKTGFSFDAGASYRLARSATLGDHLVGIMLQNPVASAEMGGVVSASNLKLSWAAALWENRIESGLDFDVKDFLARASDFGRADTANPSSVIAAAKRIEYELYYKIGIWLLRSFKVYGQLGVGERGSGYWGLGGGLNLPMVNNGRDLCALYQYNLKTDGDIASTHSVYLRGEFGMHREEAYARMMAKSLDATPNDLYNRALSLYFAKRYWDSFFIFGQIFGQYPDFFKNDWVKYYLHSCQENLDMRAPALDGFGEAIKIYPKSEMRPYADLGMMRICYREKMHERVQEQLTKLTQPQTPDSLKYHACYIAAQSHLDRRNYLKAAELLQVIPESHPEYPFAQHSLAVAAFIGENTPKAIAHLENALQTVAVSAAAREIVNRSALLLGYMFFEQGFMGKAVTALRMVDKKSYYAEDALLGLGWTAIRARQWADCLESGRALAATSNKAALRCEGMLLQSYALIMQKSYTEAVAVLRDASALISKALPPSEQELQARKTANELQRSFYDTVAVQAYRLSLPRQTSTIIQLIDSIHGAQKQVKAKIDEFLSYNDEFKRQLFFARAAAAVKEDIDYALATAEQLAGKDFRKENQTKQQEMDDEIKRLKDEIDNIDKSK